MVYSARGVTLTDGQKQSLATAVRARRGVTLRLPVSQLSGPDQLMLTTTQINKLSRAKASGRGVDLRLSKTQLSKLGGLGPFGATMLAGIAAPMIGKMLGFGQRGKGLQLPGTRHGRGQRGKGLQLPGTGRGLQLPGTGRGLQLPGTGRGLQLPGTRRGRGQKKGGILWALPALLK